MTVIYKCDACSLTITNGKNIHNDMHSPADHIAVPGVEHLCTSCWSKFRKADQDFKAECDKVCRDGRLCVIRRALGMSALPEWRAPA